MENFVCSIYIMFANILIYMQIYGIKYNYKYLDLYAYSLKKLAFKSICEAYLDYINPKFE